MKRLFIAFFWLSLSARLFAQPTVLRNNGPLVTHPGQGAGGADASAITTGTSFGASHAPNNFTRIADDFVVPAGQTWRVDSVWFYAFQQNSGTTSTITSVNVRLWRGRPDSVGATLVFGDTTTNRVIRTRFSNIYRVTTTTLTNTQRPIMVQTVNLGGAILTPGTYWLDWQTSGSLPMNAPLAPPVSILGQPVVPGANALQRTATRVWQNAQDGITPLEFPFILYGSQIQLSPFNLVSPPNDATIITEQISSTVRFVWRRAGGGTVTYRWFFWADRAVGPPTLVVSSGSDTSVAIRLSQLDSLLAGLGVARGDSIEGQWRVFAYASPTDSLGSSQTFDLVLKRKAIAQAAILLDTTDANMRASRDLLIAFLNAQGQTFDVIHRGDNNATFSIPALSPYQIVFLLGEETNTASSNARAAIRTYLQNGTPTQKARFIAFSQDFGFNHDRAAALPANRDTILTRQLCGLQFLADRPAGTVIGIGGSGQERVVNVGLGVADSVAGSFPDVLRIARSNAVVLYRFQRYPIGSDSVLAIGRNESGYATAVYGFDLRRYRAAFNSPSMAGESVSPALNRLLQSAIHFVQTGEQLPVELSEFGARRTDGGVLLSWKTASELNNAGFEVQRRRATREAFGEAWQTLGFVRGAGTTTDAQSYSFLDRTAVGNVQYRLKQIDFDGRFEYSNIIDIDAGLPRTFALEQNYPNPFNPTTVIRYQLPVESQTTLELFDILGKKIATLVNARQEAGAYSVSLDASRLGLSSGIYFYRLTAGTFAQTRKLMFVK
ncbi:MAG: T9SS type A sorting domain-containing protein [Chloroherpetonaceae bacterium]|nr:T9SS type A sorting domain-containing protein [Chloroherpetonaceae bacterium]MDW8438771.1 T9SS type A sorting domain-containing protein [Chloroherpetonaceae bacterium]